MIVSRVLNCRRSARRGSAAVEFAFVAPIFFAFIIGIVDFGRMMMVQEIMTNAARVAHGKRYSPAAPIQPSKLRSPIT